MARVAIEVGGLDLIHLQFLLCVVPLCIAFLYILLFARFVLHRLCGDEKAV